MHIYNVINLLSELRPKEVYLDRLFIENYAINWRKIGLELNMTSVTLDIIKVDYPHEVKERCRAMLKVWLQKDSEASWGKLFNAVEAIHKNYHHANVETGEKSFYHIQYTDTC